MVVAVVVDSGVGCTIWIMDVEFDVDSRQD